MPYIKNFTTEFNIDPADGIDYIAIWKASMLQLGEVQEAVSANAEKAPRRLTPPPQATAPSNNQIFNGENVCQMI